MDRITSRGSTWSEGDWRMRTRDSITKDRSRALVLLGIGSAFAGWAAIGFFLFGPVYSVATSQAGTAATSIESIRNSFQAGAALRAAPGLAAVAGLFGLVLIASLLPNTKRYRRIAASSMTVATVAIASATALAAYTIGPWLIPGLMLALMALVALLRSHWVSRSGR